MAGELQLMSSGPQEKFFTLDPDYSHFLESFKKHTNFSNEYVDLDPENEADFGSTVKFKIPQNQGDLLKTSEFKGHFTSYHHIRGLLSRIGWTCPHRTCRSNHWW